MNNCLNYSCSENNGNISVHNSKDYQVPDVNESRGSARIHPKTRSGIGPKSARNRIVTTLSQSRPAKAR